MALFSWEIEIYRTLLFLALLLNMKSKDPSLSKVRKNSKEEVNSSCPNLLIKFLNQFIFLLKKKEISFHFPISLSNFIKVQFLFEMSLISLSSQNKLSLNPQQKSSFSRKSKWSKFFSKILFSFFRIKKLKITLKAFFSKISLSLWSSFPYATLHTPSPKPCPKIYATSWIFIPIPKAFLTLKYNAPIINNHRNI